MIRIMNRLIMMIINDQNNDQAYAERNTEGLEDRTWEQALAPRLMIMTKGKISIMMMMVKIK